MRELVVTDPVTPVTHFKLRRVMEEPEACLRMLGQVAQYTALEPLEAEDRCGIDNRVNLAGIGTSKLRSIETACETALRLTMWEQHGVQPAAQEHFGQGVKELRHIGSYNCREIRTTSGSSGGMSTHATAEAIDIAGFR